MIVGSLWQSRRFSPSPIIAQCTAGSYIQVSDDICFNLEQLHTIATWTILAYFVWIALCQSMIIVSYCLV